MDYQAEAWDDSLLNPDRYDDATEGWASGPRRAYVPTSTPLPRSYEIDAVIRTTPKAWLVQLQGDANHYWLPRSYCRLMKQSQRDIIVIPHWLVTRKGFHVNPRLRPV